MIVLRQLWLNLKQYKWMASSAFAIGILTLIQFFWMSELYDYKKTDTQILTVLSKAVHLHYQKQLQSIVIVPYEPLELEPRIIPKGFDFTQTLLSFNDKEKILQSFFRKFRNPLLCGAQKMKCTRKVNFPAFSINILSLSEKSIFEVIQVDFLSFVIDSLANAGEIDDVSWGIMDYQKQKIYLEEHLEERNEYYSANIIPLDLEMIDLFPNSQGGRYAIFPYQGSTVKIPVDLKILFLLGILSLLLLTFFLFSNFFSQARTIGFNSLKYHFINNITHELQTPLSVMLFACENLMASGAQVLGPNMVFVQRLDDKTKHLTSSIKKLIEITQLKGGIVQLSLEVLDLVEILELAVNKLNPEIQERHGKVVWEYDKAEKYTTSADRAHFQNAIEKILDNAIKYSPDRLLITFNLHKEGKYIILKIKDQGIGIPKKNIGKVFQFLYRVPDKGNIQNSRGYGLGLSYVKDIIQLHGANVKVKSKVGEGTTIIIKIKKYE